MPRFTAIVPVFNGECFVREALHSVLGQSLHGCEVIVVDDGSSDGSAKAAREVSPGVQCLVQKHQGVAAARNLGAEQARGDWLAFLDADDLWYPHKLAMQAAVIDRHPELGLVYSDLDVVDGDGAIVQERALSAPLEQRRRRRRLTDLRLLAFGDRPFPYPSTVVVKRDLFLKAGGFNPAFRDNYHEDFEAFSRIFRLAPAHFLAESLIRYRRPSSAAPRGGVRDANWLILLNCLWQLWSAEPEKQAVLLPHYARHFSRQGKRLLREGRKREARDLFRLALAYDPLDAKAWRRLAASYLFSPRRRSS